MLMASVANDPLSVPGVTNHMNTFRSIQFLLFISLATAATPALSQRRPEPPTRDPHAPGYVEATELPDGEVPPADANGNFILGPTHRPDPASLEQPGVPKGKVIEFTMDSTDSKIYPGIARAGYVWQARFQ